MLSTWCRRCVLRVARHKASVGSTPASHLERSLHTASVPQSESDGERGGIPAAGSLSNVPEALRVEDARVTFRTSELKKLTDLRVPYNWYPAARSMRRRLVYHAGPTNSGKTYNAIQRFLSSGKAIYCAPLRMLAHEIYQKANEQGVPCDLLTGEEQLFASGDKEIPAGHLACTVECARLHIADTFDVAVIDEVQMIKDYDRGGAWTKAILGIPAAEVHLCGHQCAVNLLERITDTIGEKLEVIYYNRLAPLVPLDTSLKGSYSAVQPGDCVVVFSRTKIFNISRSIEIATKEPCALIYGGLPPATRVQQASLFNGRNSKCRVLVATDAIGMGLNLNIRRIVFHSLEKFDGEENSVINSSLVKQIAGRAGRYGTEYDIGEVTTFYEKDLAMLHKLLAVPEKDIEQAGIIPTFDQIELFSYHLPHASLQQILELFFKTAQLDGNYFLCDVDNVLDLAQMLQNLTLSLKDMYAFATAPVDTRKGWLKAALYKYARAYSLGEVLDFAGLCQVLHWPLPKPRTPEQLVEFENIHESLDLFFWLSMKYKHNFVDVEKARLLQGEINTIIGQSIITKFRPPRPKIVVRQPLVVRTVNRPVVTKQVPIVVRKVATPLVTKKVPITRKFVEARSQMSDRSDSKQDPTTSHTSENEEEHT